MNDDNFKEIWKKIQKKHTNYVEKNVLKGKSFVEVKKGLFKKSEIGGTYVSWHRDFLNFTGLNGKVLDIGCGPFPAIFYDRIKHLDYYGIDPKDEFAFEEGSVKFFEGVGEKLQFESNLFDHVLIAGVLDHTFDPSKVIEESARVLKPSGRLWIGGNYTMRGWDLLIAGLECLFTLKWGVIYNNAKRRILEETEDTVGHQHDFTIKDYKSLLTKAGLELMRIKKKKYPNLIFICAK